MSFMTAALDLIYFDEERYLKRNSETTDAGISKKLEKKSLQLVVCGGAIGVGFVATLFTGPTSILASAVSARHASVIRQQQKLLGQIQRLRRIYELVATYQSASNYANSSLGTSIIAIALESEILECKYIPGVPRTVTSSPQYHRHHISSREYDNLSSVEHPSPPADPSTEEKPHSAA
ncbi:hypothetical protein M408DRAFT_27076 [Serendipita vermifera MAFF 305830]|uniref:Uncharacterized protein n=1 Tax=Serendipita vermifera MAFF 305830 TaxID=933852 RepID=A0A0C2WD57_SERVB|nr:hypothetical protein M408DRAFT_27076 [Serendipita vermifera MAFF 305830]